MIINSLAYHIALYRFDIFHFTRAHKSLDFHHVAVECTFQQGAHTAV